MFARIITELGPWSWWVLGMILLAAELIMPGVFLVWIGVGAILTGALSLLFWEMGFWTWQLQAVLFAVFAGAAALAGRRLFKRLDADTDEPMLNQRSASLVGRTAVLQEPIREGRGRIKLDDTFWTVEGPDLPAGTRVKIVASSGRDLTVDAA
ncbi:NfeD family protein [Peteryoungia desertarenae]|uniref:NfeD family protein n=1 Tax=Peteryoungia desertarenae TaxID=1813451 RepID=A0ABX6QI53_9HYPH|nr:NfeD family protein [Peteryoungia desertarenae]QLF68112.1 NfeD family protein [Peteryoungia desertarenae]